MPSLDLNGSGVFVFSIHSKFAAKNHCPVRDVNEIKQAFMSIGPGMCQLMNNTPRSYEPSANHLTKKKKNASRATAIGIHWVPLRARRQGHGIHSLGGGKQLRPFH